MKSRKIKILLCLLWTACGTIYGSSDQPPVESEHFSYSERFREFRSRHNAPKKTLEIIRSLPENQKNRVTKILSIGSGDGSFDQDLTSLFPNLKHVDMLEPDSNLFSLLNTKKNPIFAKVSKIQIDFESFETNEKYDLILISHVFYYFKDRKAMLQKALAHLGDQGEIWIFQNTEVGIGAIQASMAQLFPKNSYGVKSFKFVSNQLEELLVRLSKKNSLSFVRRRIEANLIVKDSINRRYSELSRASKAIIHFFLEKESISSREGDAVITHLNRHATKGSLYHPTDFFVVKN
jgi:phospholipid N-methyltransferase